MLLREIVLLSFWFFSFGSVDDKTYSDHESIRVKRSKHFGGVNSYATSLYFPPRITFIIGINWNPFVSQFSIFVVPGIILKIEALKI